MVFLGDYVRLRPLRPSDLASIVQWTMDPEVDKFIDGGYPRDLAAADQWYTESAKDRQVRRFAIETSSGQLIGDMALDQIAWRRGEAELTIRIGEKEFWGRGFGTDAILTVLDVAFSRLGLSRVYLRVYSFNQRAIRAYRKCGFRGEGVLRRSHPQGHWKDIVLMRKLGSEHAARYGASENAG